MASPDKQNDAEIGDRDGDEKYEMEESTNPSGGLLAKPREENPPEKKAGRASFFLWIIVNTLATIAIVCSFSGLC